MDKTVILVTGSDRREMVREALTKLGEAFTNAVKDAKKIFIHPNLVSPYNKAASTDVEVVRGIVDHISLIRSDEILIGDASYYDTKKAFEIFSYPSLKRSGNIKLVDLNAEATTQSYTYASDLKKKPIGFSRIVSDSDLNIVVVPAKMHSYYIVTLSIKTHTVGSCVVKKSPFGIHARWPWFHTGFKSAHLSVADMYGVRPAQLAVIDATRAMEGEGPTSGDEMDLGWLIASFNPVAADALGAYLMGLDPSDIGYLYHLDKKGLGPIDPEAMSIMGADPKILRRELKRPSSYPEILAWR
ncbi:DUF362 domain-containing protein [Patescibacteria group bacterium]|nr:DUF362 domain-containing protein [Patescibacteria group bacterium]